MSTKVSSFLYIYHHFKQHFHKQQINQVKLLRMFSLSQASSMANNFPIDQINALDKMMKINFLFGLATCLFLMSISGFSSSESNCLPESNIFMSTGWSCVCFDLTATLAMYLMSTFFILEENQINRFALRLGMLLCGAGFVSGCFFFLSALYSVILIKLDYDYFRILVLVVPLVRVITISLFKYVRVYYYVCIAT